MLQRAGVVLTCLVAIALSLNATRASSGRPSRYVLLSQLSYTDADGRPMAGSWGSLAIVRSLDRQERDLERADFKKLPELGNLLSVWTHDGHIYAATYQGHTERLTRYEVRDDDSLVARGEIDFLREHHVTRVGESAITFVAPDKAYLVSRADKAIVWNPQTMTITGVIKLLTPRQAGVPAGIMNAAPTVAWLEGVVSGGKVYQPLFWPKGQMPAKPPGSFIVVIDIATDRVVRVEKVPCEDLRVGSVDGQGNLWFSAGWESDTSCSARITAGSGAVSTAFRAREVTGGRARSPLRALGDGALVLSTFDHERDRPDWVDDPTAPLWRLWRYDVRKKAARPLEGIPKNNGFFAVAAREKPPLLLVGDADRTTVYAIENGRATRRFDVPGRASRLLRID